MFAQPFQGDKKISFDLPAGNLDDALREFSIRSSLQFLYPSELTAAIESKAITGEYTPLQVLQLLLKDTNLTFTQINSNTVAIHARIKQDKKSEKKKEQDHEEQILEEIIVHGYQSSLRSSLHLKKNAMQFMEVVGVIDISRLPDFNVAETIQRVSGVQIERNNLGDGDRFQVRGLVENNVEVNGFNYVSNSEFERNDPFGVTPSSLFKTIKVIKSPTADTTEGSIGATIRMETFKPFDFKKNQTFNVSILGIDHNLNDKLGRNIKSYWSQKLLDDRLGILLNINTQKRYTLTNQVGANIKPTRDKSEPVAGLPDYSVLVPNKASIELADYESDNQSANAVVQYKVRDNLELHSEFLITQNVDINKVSAVNVFFDKDIQRLTDYTLDLYSRPNPGGFYIQPSEGQFIPYEDAIRRGVVVKGRVETIDSRDDEREINAELAEIAGRFDEVRQNNKLFNVGVNWLIDEQLSLKIDATFTTSGNRRENTFSIFRPQYNPDLDGDGNYDTVLQPALYFDYRTKNDIPTFNIDFSELNYDRARFGMAPFNLNSPELLSWNQIGAEFRTRDASNQEVKIDFDWQTDNSIITQIDYGFRFARLRSERDKSNIGRYNLEGDPNFKRLINWEEHSIFSQAWINGDGEPSNDVIRSQNNYTDLIKLDPSLADNFFIIADKDLLFTSTTGDIPRRFVRPQVFSRTYWQDEIFDRYFPGRRAGPGEDGIACPRNTNNEIINSNDPVCLDDITAVPAWTWLRNELHAFDLQESTYALYAMANYDFQWNNYFFDGNFGIRAIQTRLNSSSLNGLRDENTSVENDYWNYLPSFNLRMDINDESIIRLGLARTITRPAPYSIVPRANINAQRSTIHLGNPELKPNTANQLDIAWEWYYGLDTLVSLAAFYKDLSNFEEIRQFEAFIDDQNNIVEKSENARLINIIQPTNGGGGKILGFEFSTQTTLVFLPKPFDQLSLFANYTYTDSNQYSGIGELDGKRKPLERLSDNAFNLALSFESPLWAARLAYNYRDEFLAGPTLQKGDRQLYVRDNSAQTGQANEFAPYWIGGEEYIAAYGQLDFSFSVNVVENLVLFAHIKDVLAQPRERYLHPDRRFIRQYNLPGKNFSFGLSWSFDQ